MPCRPNELYVLDIGTGSLRRITDDGDGAVQHGSPLWSRDGRALYYTSDRATEFSHLRRLDLDTGEETVLSDEIPWDVSSIQQTGDGEQLLIAVNEDGRTRHYTTDPLGVEMHHSSSFRRASSSAAAPEPSCPPGQPHRPARHPRDLETQELTLWAGTEPSESSATLASSATRPSTRSMVNRVVSRRSCIRAWGRVPVRYSSMRRDKRDSGRPRVAGITSITPNVRGSGYGRSRNWTIST